MRLYGRILVSLTITAAVSLSIPDPLHASTYSLAIDAVCGDSACGQDETTSRMILYGSVIPVSSLFEQRNSTGPDGYMLKGPGLDGNDCEYQSADGRADSLYPASTSKDNGCREREGNKGRDDRREHDDHDNHGDDDGNHNNKTPVPEPSAFVLAGTGLLYLAFLRRYMRKKR